MADYRRRWWDVRLRTLVVWILLLTIGYTLYTYWSDYSERAARRERELLSPASGAACTAVLRNDALGSDRGRPDATVIDGVPNYVEGRFVMMNDQWVVLDGLKSEAPQQWIPRENVLVLQVQSR